MEFRHLDEIWWEFPELAAGALVAEGITADAAVAPRIARFGEIATTRLAAGSEGELPEIKAWRRAFSKMGLRPTQYRCAAEALLRRYRKEGALPSIHPLVDLCNAVSLAFAVPIAVFDVEKVAEHLHVRHAAGDEAYLAFSGETENPAPREVIFADATRHAHARRWSNRQSALSAVGPNTRKVLIVAEALHETARADIERLIGTLAEELGAVWALSPASAMLTRSAQRFNF